MSITVLFFISVQCLDPFSGVRCPDTYQLVHIFPVYYYFPFIFIILFIIYPQPSPLISQIGNPIKILFSVIGFCSIRGTISVIETNIKRPQSKPDLNQLLVVFFFLGISSFMFLYLSGCFISHFSFSDFLNQPQIGKEIKSINSEVRFL